MKKTTKTLISFALIAVLTISCSSCSIFKSMRENAELAAQFTPQETPAQDKIVEYFNTALNTSKANAETIVEKISYSAGAPEVFKTEEEKAGTLDAAANQLKNFIMSGNPGSAEYWVKGAPDGDGEYQKKAIDEALLNTLDKAFIFNLEDESVATRNISVETVKDEKDKEVLDEEGNPVTTEKIADDTLHIVFNYYEATALDGTEYETNENGEPAEETTFVYSDKETIESVFGTPEDKEAVIKHFDSAKDYITVKDYEIEYTNCSIKADADLLNDTLSFVTLQKEMKITAKAECVGALASYGEVEIVFTLSKSTTYEFTYKADAAIVPATTEPAASEDVETESATQEESTTNADTTTEVSVDENNSTTMLNDNTTEAESTTTEE